MEYTKQNQVTQEILSNTNTKIGRKKSRSIICKLLNTKDKDKNLKGSQGKKVKLPIEEKEL